MHFKSSGASGGAEGVEDFSSYAHGYGVYQTEIKFNNGLKFESSLIYKTIANGKPVELILPTGTRVSETTATPNLHLSVFRPIGGSAYTQLPMKMSFGEHTSAVSFDYGNVYFSGSKVKFYDANNNLLGEETFKIATGLTWEKSIYFRAKSNEMIAYMEIELVNVRAQVPPGFQEGNYMAIDNLRWGDNAISHHDSKDEINEVKLSDDLSQLDIDIDAIYPHEILIEADEPHFDLHNLERAANSLTTVQLSEKGDVELTVSFEDILHLGKKDLFIEDGKTQLMVNGDAGDVVQLKDILPEGSDISEWQHQQGTVTVAGVDYEVYSHGDDAELLVQLGVKTELI